MEIELGFLLALVILGTGIFARFEGETAWWRKVLKWTVLSGGTLLLARSIGHLALLLPAGLGLLGVSFHFWWCRRNGIHPTKALPRRRYYELRGWQWPD